MPRRSPPTEHQEAAASPRIIGGSLRGRRLDYAPAPGARGGQPRTRPMKDRVRETLFDLLGPAVRGRVALDLFAGTGALGFEALSRGAVRAIFMERHFPTADALRRSAAALGVDQAVDVRSGDALAWAKRLPADLPRSSPWLVFFSPPWNLLVDRPADFAALVAVLRAAAPAESVFVVESDAAFDATVLPDAVAWRRQEISPAVLHIHDGQDGLL